VVTGRCGHLLLFCWKQHVRLSQPGWIPFGRVSGGFSVNVIVVDRLYQAKLVHRLRGHDILWGDLQGEQCQAITTAKIEEWTR
jgi:hypothetical protein